MRGNEQLAVLEPAKAPRRTHSRGGRLTRDDSLYNIIGAASGPDDGIHDVSTDKQKYLAEAYADLHE